MLKNLNTYKSPGPDDISPRILKECSQVLSSPLALLLNTSFSLGKLPSMWKNANITPVYKKGNRNLREELSSDFTNVYSMQNRREGGEKPSRGFLV